MDIANPVANPVASRTHFLDRIAIYLSFKIFKKAKTRTVNILFPIEFREKSDKYRLAYGRG